MLKNIFQILEDSEINKLKVQINIPSYLNLPYSPAYQPNPLPHPSIHLL